LQIATKRADSRRTASFHKERASTVAALSELAAEVQKQRTVATVLETAGQGVLRLGMRLYAFEVRDDDLVLHSLATARSRLAAIEGRIGRPLKGLRAPISEVPLAAEVVRGRRVVHRQDLDLFHSFLRAATDFEPAELDASPATAGINNGVLAPLFVREEPWGLLGIVSPTLTGDDADAVAFFATHLGSALEVAESIEALARMNRELATCQEDLARAHADLIERERLSTLGEVATVAAQEIRNPLCVLFNSIGGLREFVEAGAPAEKLADAKTFASMAREELERLESVVSDLLELARPHPPALRVGSVLPVLESVAAATAPDGRVCLEVTGELPPLEFDPMFLQQALLNLVLNGLQAIAKDGTVTLRACAADVDGSSFVRIDVCDDGMGIPADVRASIFEPFFTTKPSATGLGLAVVKRVVDTHGGHLAVESGPRGTTFRVMLPSV
jgi:signal transduction histidine kinase